ncbi:unnamed protein product [Pseudo-nitzschia multistriata]|uniref:Uncharacterized protein n=1 Tax=Pseudo-nitzschia multistriata TaxID=183589 RepID=A0A448ZJG2_9STRA|nr:unnamed protein product [Pseudo-nitzschia multistriata]
MFRTSHFFYGFWLGLMIQSISLGSTAIIVIYWGAGDGESSDSIISNRKHGFFYFVLFILSRSWWLLFPAIFIAIDEGLMGGKGQGIMGKCFSRFNRSNAENVLSKPSQTEVFFGGIRFHIGIIFGCFVIWGAIDLYFGASLGVFVGLLASLLFCLSLCYGMVVIHDRFLSHDRAVAKNTTTTEAIAAVAAVIPQSPDQRKVVFV